MKKFVSLLLILVMILAAMPVYADEALPLDAESAILVDMTTGTVLYEKNADTRLYPASTAKMLTAYLAIQNFDMGQYLTVTEKDLENGAGGIDLQLNESIGVGVLISAMVLSNADDVAYLLANNIAGDSAAFADMMNALAEEIGCTNSHFTNPAGADDPDQYTSAEDLAKIAAYCMQNEMFAKIVAKSTMVIDATDYSPIRYLANYNLLLHDETAASRVYVNNELRFCKYEGCIGIQSGYSEKAGGCLVSAASSNGTTLVAVVMNSGASDRFADSIKLLDYGFANFKTVRLTESLLDTGEIKVEKGSVDTVATKALGAEYVTISADESANELSTHPMLDEYIEAPASAGTKVGTLQILSNLNVVGEYDVVIVDNLEEGNFFQRNGFSDLSIGMIILYILAAIGLLSIIIVIYIIFERKRTIRLKAERAKKRAENAAKDRDLVEAWEKSHNTNGNVK